MTNTRQTDDDQVYGRKIQAVFAAHGRDYPEINAFVRFCLQHDIFGEETQDHWRFSAAKRAVEQALRAADGAGLPFAGRLKRKSDGGEVVWAMRPFWNLDDYAVNYSERKKQGEAILIVANRIRGEAVERFGVAPFNAAVLRNGDATDLPSAADY